MKIGLISDLHLEEKHSFNNSFQDLLTNKYGIDILIIAGDLCQWNYSFYLYSFLNDISIFYKWIIYVPGNHEYYESKITDTITVPNNIFLLNNEIKVIEGQRFLGATLWSQLSHDPSINLLIRQHISDFRMIGGFNVDKCIQLNKISSDFIKKNIKEGDIVVTHFLPSHFCVAPQYKNSMLNPYFVGNEWFDFIHDNPIKAWLFGHTHSKTEHELNGTELLCNPLGYKHEMKDNYKPLILEILR